MEFHFMGNATFYADDIEDAFIKLSAHFTALANGDDAALDMLGEFLMHPTRDCSTIHGNDTEDL